MAEVKEQTSSEPTMEEILASIRKIISDDGTANPPVQSPTPKMVAVQMDDLITDEVVELTQVVKDDGSIVDAKSLPPLEPPKVEEPLIVERAPVHMPSPRSPVEKLVSDTVFEETAHSLSTLTNTIENGHSTTAMAIGDTSKTIEHLVLELLRPHLKQWLDQNLHGIVERLVQKEIDRISRKARD